MTKKTTTPAIGNDTATVADNYTRYIPARYERGAEPKKQRAVYTTDPLYNDFLELAKIERRTFTEYAEEVLAMHTFNKRKELGLE